MASHTRNPVHTLDLIMSGTQYLCLHHKIAWIVFNLSEGMVGQQYKQTLPRLKIQTTS